MTTEPNPPPRVQTGRPTATTRPVTGQARPPARVVTVSSPGPLIGAFLVLLLGAALGVANQGAAGTSMGLRIPALLAALLMVGQGVFDIRRHLPKRRVVEEQDTVFIDEPGNAPRATELAVVRPIPAQQPITSAPVRANAQNMTVPVVVMVLAAWLGLADLRIDSPPSLTVLSLIASFALFALGWSLLPARRAP